MVAPTESSNGGIAQLGERLLCKQEVVGSIPSASTSGLLLLGGEGIGADGHILSVV